VLFAVALLLAPCHNRLCGNMSPLTASVNDSSAGVLVVLVVLVALVAVAALVEPVELATAVKVLVVAVLREPVEPVAHAVSATTTAQNLISLRKCIRNKLENV
jgi:hypothetical protein